MPLNRRVIVARYTRMIIRHKKKRPDARSKARPKRRRIAAREEKTRAVCGERDHLKRDRHKRRCPFYALTYAPVIALSRDRYFIRDRSYLSSVPERCALYTRHSRKLRNHWKTRAARDLLFPLDSLSRLTRSIE